MLAHLDALQPIMYGGLFRVLHLGRPGKSHAIQELTHWKCNVCGAVTTKKDNLPQVTCSFLNELCLEVALYAKYSSVTSLKVVRNSFMARANWVLLSRAARFLKPRKPSKQIWRL